MRCIQEMCVNVFMCICMCGQHTHTHTHTNTHTHTHSGRALHSPSEHWGAHLVPSPHLGTQSEHCEKTLAADLVICQVPFTAPNRALRSVRRCVCRWSMPRNGRVTLGFDNIAGSGRRRRSVGGCAVNRRALGHGAGHGREPRKLWRPALLPMGLVKQGARQAPMRAHAVGGSAPGARADSMQLGVREGTTRGVRVAAGAPRGGASSSSTSIGPMNRGAT